MQILLTDAFAARARRSPAAVSGLVRRAAQSRPLEPAGAATALEDGSVVGWSSRPGRLELWYRLDPAEAEQAAPAPALAGLSKAELRDLGVPDAHLREVQQLRRRAELEALPLEPRVKERLLFALLQQLSGRPPAPDELRFRAANPEHLDRFLHGDITQLLLNLDSSQRQIVELAGAGPIIVRGVAGSGKTAVALHRIYESLAQRSLLDAPRILYLTFNRALCSVAKELLVELGLGPDDLDVSTLHRWCMARLPRGLQVAKSQEQRKLVEAAVARVRAEAQAGGGGESALWSYPLEFWCEELHRIKGSGLTTAAEYASLYRYGAGRALDQRLRGQVWRAREAYDSLLRERRLVDWDDVVRLAYEELRARPREAPAYDQVLVDEAQDLTVMAMRVAAALVRPEGTLLVSYDPAQSIYERGFRWKSYGLTVHGARSFELRKNFRNTAEILAAARPLLSRMKDTSDTGEPGAAEEVLAPEAAARHGEPPRLLAVAAGRELDALSEDIRRAIRDEGVPPRNIAVLCYPNWVRERVFAALAAAGVQCQKHDDESFVRVGDASVKVLPMKSAKGLEFPVVYLLATGAKFKPPVEGEKEQLAWREQMGRCFYMAMTRAMSRLVLVYAENDPAEYLRPLLEAGAAARVPYFLSP